MSRVAPPVINVTNVCFDGLRDAFKKASQVIGEKLVPAFEALAGAIREPIRRMTMTPRQLAEEYASSFQTELRTPPSDWPCTPSPPSPRLFGLDRSEW